MSSSYHTAKQSYEDLDSTSDAEVNIRTEEETVEYIDSSVRIICGQFLGSNTRGPVVETLPP